MPATESGGRSAKTAGSAPTTVIVSRLASPSRSATTAPVTAPIAAATSAVPATTMVTTAGRTPPGPSRPSADAGFVGSSGRAGPTRAHGSGIVLDSRQMSPPGPESVPGSTGRDQPGPGAGWSVIGPSPRLTGLVERVQPG